VHRLKESQKTYYEMCQPYKLNAFASLKKVGGGRKGRKVGESSKRANVFKKERAKHQLGPTQKGGKMSREKPPMGQMGSKQGESRLLPVCKSWNS
jgi:hypothetical protein